MRTITRPPHFHNNGAVYSFEEFITSIVARSYTFSRDLKGIRAADRIVKSPLHIAEDDWVLLCDAVKNPTSGYPIPLPHRLLPYVDAVLNARDLEAEKVARLTAEEAARLTAEEAQLTVETEAARLRDAVDMAAEFAKPQDEPTEPHDGPVSEHREPGVETQNPSESIPMDSEMSTSGES